MVQAFAARFMLHQQLAAPEHIDIAAFAVRLFNGFLKAGNTAVCDAEYIKESITK